MSQQYILRAHSIMRAVYSESLKLTSGYFPFLLNSGLNQVLAFSRTCHLSPHSGRTGDSWLALRLPAVVAGDPGGSLALLLPALASSRGSLYSRCEVRVSLWPSTGVDSEFSGLLSCMPPAPRCVTCEVSLICVLPLSQL